MVAITITVLDQVELLILVEQLQADIHRVATLHIITRDTQLQVQAVLEDISTDIEAQMAAQELLLLKNTNKD